MRRRFFLSFFCSARSSSLSGPAPVARRLPVTLARPPAGETGWSPGSPGPRGRAELTEALPTDADPTVALPLRPVAPPPTEALPEAPPTEALPEARPTEALPDDGPRC
ncbi:hypothetical protein GCM10029992_11700 [Glycomyces albus]